MRCGRQRWWRIIQTRQDMGSLSGSEGDKARPQPARPSGQQDDLGASTTNQSARPMSGTQEKRTCGHD